MRQSTNGRYAHPFLYIELAESVELDDSGNIELTGTLTHECCHFLQDITTNFGVMGITAYSLALQDLIQHAKIDKKILHIPVRSCNMSVLTYHKYMLSLWGNFYVMNSTEIMNYNLLSSRCQSYPDIYELQLNNGKTIHFHTFMILESMAKSLELSLYPNTIEPMHYPYMICNKLIKHIHKDFQDSPENVLALCDATLMHTNPGVLFVESLEVMKDKGIILNDMHEIYNFIEEEPELRPYRRLPYEGYHTHHVLAFRNIKNLCELMGLESGWILQGLKNALYLRNTRPRFWTSVLQGTSQKDRLSTFNNIMQEVGFPVVYDRKGHIYVQGVKNENELFGYNIFRVIHFLYDLLAQGETMCDLYSYCTSNDDMREFVGRNCFFEPWKQVDDGKKCLFAVIWKQLGLTTNVNRIPR